MKQREAKSIEKHKNILENQIWIPEYWSELTVATSKNVEGFEMNHFGFYKLNKVNVK